MVLKNICMFKMPLIALAFLGYLLYSSATKLSDAISFEPVGFKLSQQILQLKIINPTDTSATVQGVSGYINANRIRIGSYQVADRFIVPAFGSVIINVRLNLDKMEVFSQITSLLTTKKVPEISVTGSISTSVGSIDFENQLVKTMDLK